MTTSDEALAASTSLVPSRADSLVARFRGQVSLSPTALAIRCSEARWTYLELLERAEAWAASLMEAGVQPGDRVVLQADRTPEAIAALLGVLFAGACYVPVAPDVPEERLAQVVDRCEARMMVVVPQRSAQPSMSLKILSPEGVTGRADGASLPEVDGSATAYVLFTSGSTGAPKGVEVTHSNVVAMLAAVGEALEPAVFAVSATATALTFDPSVLEIFAPLTTGGAVCPVRHVFEIADSAEPVTFFVATPGLATELARLKRFPATLRAVVVGGERVTATAAREILEGLPTKRLVHAYGPTEATVLVTLEQLRDAPSVELSLGKALSGTELAIADDHGNPSSNQRGELLLAGPQIAKGYLGGSSRDDASFFSFDEGVSTQRWYRTGDLVERGHDGRIYFRGRIDRQVKLRGFRIELDEVEVALQQVAGIREACVAVASVNRSDALVGYVTLEDAQLDSAAIQEALQARLPQYMIPTVIVPLDKLPLNSNGKVDRARLPVPQAPRARIRQADTESPFADLVADAVEDVLGVRPASGSVDVVRDLGCSSLMLVRILGRLEEVSEVRLPISSLLADTTVNGLAELLQSPGSPQGSLRLSAGDDRQPLMLIHAYLGGVLRYRNLAPYLPPGLTTYGVFAQGSAADVPAETVEELAARALGEIRALQPEGPYRLGGHSAGGLIAYEVADQLRREGEVVTSLLLLDTPVMDSRLAYYWGELVLNGRDLLRRSWPERVRRLREWYETRKRLSDPSFEGADVITRIARAEKLSNRAVLSYRIGNYPGDAVVISTAEGRLMAGCRVRLGWKKHIAGKIRVIRTPGGHTTIFQEPFIRPLGDAVSRGLGARG